MSRTRPGEVTDSSSVMYTALQAFYRCVQHSSFHGHFADVFTGVILFITNHNSSFSEIGSLTRLVCL